MPDNFEIYDLKILSNDREGRFFQLQITPPGAESFEVPLPAETFNDSGEGWGIHPICKQILGLIQSADLRRMTMPGVEPVAQLQPDDTRFIENFGKKLFTNLFSVEERIKLNRDYGDASKKDPPAGLHIRISDDVLTDRFHVPWEALYAQGPERLQGDLLANLQRPLSIDKNTPISRLVSCANPPGASVSIDGVLRISVITADPSPDENTVSPTQEYKTISKRVIDTPASTRTIEIPAEYKTITKRVVDTPASTRTIDIPAEYKTITRSVVDTPPSTRVDRKPMIVRTYTETNRVGCPDGYTTDTGAVEGGSGAGGNGGSGDCIRVVEIPAEYGSTTRRVVKTPATTRTVEIPAQYATVTRRNLVKKGGFTEWREVLCGEKVTGYTIRQIQSALSSRGYDPGPNDNILGSRTKAALTKFQKDNNLPVGQLDMETLKALGINY